MSVQACSPEDSPPYPFTDEACPGPVGSDTAAHVLSMNLDLDLDLDACLFQLSRLAAERSHAQAVLARITTRAAHAIPGADGAGLTVLRDTRPLTVAASEPFVAKVDDIQYTLREGPCLEAARRGQTARSGSLAADVRWARFGPRAGRLGVHSALSLPLVTPAGVIGSLNAYGHSRDAFDEHSQSVATVIAVPAAVSVENLQVLAQIEHLGSSLRTALADRAVVDQAVGILRSRHGLGADEALSRLRGMTQDGGDTPLGVADEIVHDAVVRARKDRGRALGIDHGVG